MRLPARPIPDVLGDLAREAPGTPVVLHLAGGQRLEGDLQDALPEGQRGAAVLSVLRESRAVAIYVDLEAIVALEVGVTAELERAASLGQAHFGSAEIPSAEALWDRVDELQRSLSETFERPIRVELLPFEDDLLQREGVGKLLEDATSLLMGLSRDPRLRDRLSVAVAQINLGLAQGPSATLRDGILNLRGPRSGDSGTRAALEQALNGAFGSA